MTRIKIKIIVWDLWNLEHIKKHKVEVSEIEEAIKNISYHKRTHKERYLVVGRSGKKIISSVLMRQRLSDYYLVTARDASKKERKRVYEKENKK